MKKEHSANKEYKKPVVKTSVTPKEIRDLEQPCAFYLPGEERPRRGEE